MSFLKDLFGRSSRSDAADIKLPEGPLGLAPGVIVRVDLGLKLLFEGVSSVRIPDAQEAWAQGIVDLGHSNWLTRLYLNDQDYWLQVHTTGARDGQVEALVLFNYLSCQTVHSNNELALLAGPKSKIGVPSYEHEGNIFHREWGAAEGQTDLVEFQESVTNPQESYGIKHLSMFYTRDIGLTNRKELLLFSVEEDLEGNVSVTTSLGVTLFTTDLQTI